MKMIYKYPLNPGQKQLKAYRDMQPLTVGQQMESPVLWGLIDSEEEPETYDIRVLATGEEFPDHENFDYLGSSVGAAYVWHVFIRTGNSALN
jgi:hypothetical protein